MTKPPHFAFDRSAYPIVITAHRMSNGVEVWRKRLQRPGPFYVPPIAGQVGEPVTIRIVFGDGTMLDLATK